MGIVIGILIIVVIIGLILFPIFIGKPCLKKKCNGWAKYGHVYCKKCEKNSGIYEAK